MISLVSKRDGKRKRERVAICLPEAESSSNVKPNTTLVHVHGLLPSFLSPDLASPSYGLSPLACHSKGVKREKKKSPMQLTPRVLVFVDLPVSIYTLIKGEGSDTSSRTRTEIVREKNEKKKRKKGKKKRKRKEEPTI